MKNRLCFVAVTLLFSLPLFPAQAVCRVLECDIDWGLFGDSCMCSQVGITDMNGEPQSCAIRVRLVRQNVEPGYPPIYVEICQCEFSRPCTSGPV